MSEDGFQAMLRRTEEATQRSPRDVVEADAANPMADSEFDDAIYLALLGRIPTPEDLESHPPAVQAYLSTRMVEWQIGSGGVDSALDYAGEYLDMAKAGYRLLGQDHSAELVERIATADADEEFQEIMATIEGPPWNGVPWADAERVALVRASRGQFLIE